VHGFMARDREHVYFMGIIDILQLYDCSKQAGSSASLAVAIRSGLTV